MRRLAEAIVAEWAATAATKSVPRLNTTLSPYKKAIQIREVTENSCTVSLPGDNVDDGKVKVSTIARMIEFGMGPGGIGTEGSYDVRTFILKSRRSVNVPFIYNNAQIRQMGLKKQGGIGAKATLDIAKALIPTRVQGGSWKDGQQLGTNFTRIVNNPNTNARHATDRLHGLRRMVSQKSNGDETSRFITFRKASFTLDSNDKRWIHRGIKARRFAIKVHAKVPQIWKALA